MDIEPNTSQESQDAQVEAQPQEKPEPEAQAKAQPQEKPQPVSPKPTRMQRLRAWWLRHRIKLQIGLLILLIATVYFWHKIFITIDAGELGVMYRRFAGGTVTDQVYEEGLHVIPPWDKLTPYNVRVNQRDIDFDVLTSDALAIRIQLSVRYHPRRQSLGFLHKEVGPDYVDKIIVPEVQSALRTLIGRYQPEEIYQTKEGLLEKMMAESLLQVAERYIDLDDLLMKKVELPPVVQQAIERKLTQRELAMEFEYRLLQAEQEAKRKKVEAQGIRDFQDIVSEGISDQLLRWRGIEATLELAKSPNAKIVIFGSGETGLPLILNAGDALSSSPATANPMSATAPIWNVTEINTTFQPDWNTSMVNPLTH